MGRTERTRALLLRSVDYRDADRILTLLTEAHGKVSAIARSARRSKRRFAGALEPYTILEAELAFGRGQLATLASARPTRAFTAVMADLTKMALAGAALELVRESLPEREPEDRVFEALIALLSALDEAPEGREELLLCFQARVLAVIGFAPGVDVCARCGKRAPAGQVALFDPAVGAVVCRACGGGPVKLSGRAREVLRVGQGGAWGDAATEELPAPVLSEVRSALSRLCEHHLGRQLKGPSFVAQVREISS